jgi:hypothetical protein
MQKADRQSFLRFIPHFYKNVAKSAEILKARPLSLPRQHCLFSGLVLIFLDFPKI